jgi:hypothetical protein
MRAQIAQFDAPAAVVAARDAERITYGWLVAADGVLAGLGVMTPITKGCRPARMMVAMPVPMASATEDAQAETVQRLCMSTSWQAVNPFLRSTAKFANVIAAEFTPPGDGDDRRDEGGREQVRRPLRSRGAVVGKGRRDRQDDDQRSDPVPEIQEAARTPRAACGSGGERHRRIAGPPPAPGRSSPLIWAPPRPPAT